MKTEKTVKRKVTTSISAPVLAATGHRGATRKIGAEIDGAFAERDRLRSEVEQLKAQLVTMEAAYNTALAVRDRWIENVCATLNELEPGQWIIWSVGRMEPPTAPESHP